MTVVVVGTDSGLEPVPAVCEVDAVAEISFSTTLTASRVPDHRQGADFSIHPGPRRLEQDPLGAHGGDGVFGRQLAGPVDCRLRPVSSNNVAVLPPGSRSPGRPDT